MVGWFDPGQLLATGFSYDPEVRAEQAAGLGGLMDGFADVRRLGSAALDLCLVADGTHDRLLATSPRYREVLARAALEVPADVVDEDVLDLPGVGD